MVTLRGGKNAVEICLHDSRVVDTHDCIFSYKVAKFFHAFLNIHWTATLHFIGDRYVRIAICITISYYAISLLCVSSLALSWLQGQYIIAETRDKTEPQTTNV